MNEKTECIGGVKIDLTHYSGQDYYSDGPIEDSILNSLVTGQEDHFLKKSSKFAVLYHLSDIRHNIIEWYPFIGTENVLEIGSGCGAVTGAIAERVKNVTCVELSKKTVYDQCE